MDDEVDWEQIDATIDAFAAVVRRQLAAASAPTDAGGYRRATAAAMLLHGLELLDAARACREPVQFPAAELVLRSAVEVALRGRYLLMSPAADDELQRMQGAYLKRKEETAKHCAGGKFRGSPPEFVAAVPPSAKPAQNLYELAKGMDTHPRKRSSRVPALWTYRCLYQWLSNAATHAGLHAVERFTVAVGGRAAFVIEPEPLSSLDRRHYVMVAGQLGELAREVFEAFQLDAEELEATGVRLP